MLEMNLIPLKGIWSNDTGSIISPYYQKIIFNNGNSHVFSFKRQFNKNVSIERQANEVWLEKIPASLYKENDNYKVSVEFYYRGVNIDQTELCTGQVITATTPTTPYITLYPNLTTGYWACFNSTSHKQELVLTKELCNGIPNCLDASDETSMLCKPDFMGVSVYVLIFVIGFGLLGLFVYIAHQWEINENWDDDASVNTDYNHIDLGISSILMETSGKIHRKNEGLNRKHTKQIRKMFTPCQHDDATLHIIKVLYTVSLDVNLRYTSWKIMDLIIKMEQEVHASEEGAVCCLMSNFETKNSHLSNFMIDVMERDNFFPRNWRNIKDTFSLGINRIGLFLTFILLIVYAISKIALFYFDVIRDLYITRLFIYVRDNLLRDENLNTRFDTVGGLNFDVIIAYVIFILLVGETGVYWQMFNRQDILMDTFPQHQTSRLGRILVFGFPIHFIFLQGLKDKRQISLLKAKLSDVFCTKVLIDHDSMALDLATISNKINTLSTQQYYLHWIQKEAQIIQSALEREPQMVLQLCLYVLMKSFDRLSLFFSNFVGISAETLFISSFLLSSTIMAKSISDYLHHKRWPVLPNIFGLGFHLFAIGFLVVPKIILISYTLLNAFYLYPFIHGLNLFLVWLYNKLVCGNIESSFEQVLVMGIAPGFFKSTKKTSKNKVLNYFLRVSKKYGFVLHPVMLQLLTLFIYLSIGTILRHTVFPFSIKTENGVKYDIIEQENADGIEHVEESYLDEVLYEHPLNNVPFVVVAGYLIGIVLYVLFAIIYKWKFSPPKEVIAQINPMEPEVQNQRDLDIEHNDARPLEHVVVLSPECENEPQQEPEEYLESKELDKEEQEEEEGEVVSICEDDMNSLQTTKL